MTTEIKEITIKIVCRGKAHCMIALLFDTREAILYNFISLSQERLWLNG